MCVYILTNSMKSAQEQERLLLLFKLCITQTSLVTSHSETSQDESVLCLHAATRCPKWQVSQPPVYNGSNNGSRNSFCFYMSGFCYCHQSTMSSMWLHKTENRGVRHLHDISVLFFLFFFWIHYICRTTNAILNALCCDLPARQEVLYPICSRCC